MHEVRGDRTASGRAKVEAGTGWIARAVAKLMRFPPSGDYPLQVRFEELPVGERWTRDFGGHRFSSRLRAGKSGHVVEAFGPLRFQFELLAKSSGELQMNLTGWSLGPIPFPALLAPRSHAREWNEDGSFHFDVPIAMPLVGPIVHYKGWLRP